MYSPAFRHSHSASLLYELPVFAALRLVVVIANVLAAALTAIDS